MTPSRSPAASAESIADRGPSGSERDADVRRGIEDLENGDYIELSREELARCVTTGESPWPDESDA